MTENILKCPLVYLASDEIQLKIQQGKSIFDFPCSEFPYLPRKKSWNSKKKKKNHSLFLFTSFLCIPWCLVGHIYYVKYNITMLSFQNVARNGATSFDALKYMKSISRDPKKDQPVILIYSMVGNDVCNEQTDTLNHMTTTKEFYDNLMQTLTYMESTLPPNSHVILVGLIGNLLFRIIFNSK